MLYLIAMSGIERLIDIAIVMIVWLWNHPVIAVLILFFLVFGFGLPKDNFDNSTNSYKRY